MYIMKTDKVHRFDRTIVIPRLGETKISNEGMFLVETLELAKEVEALEAGYYYYGEVSKQLADGNSNSDKKEDKKEKDSIKKQIIEEDLNKNDDSNNIGSKVEENELSKSLSGLSAKELKKLAEPFSNEKQIWSPMNKTQLVEYLKSKLIEE